MTELLFHSDSYIKEFKATVTEVVDNGVVLDRTAFYIGGGGQPNDTGLLQELLSPYDPGLMKANQVSTLVNSPKNYGPELIAPVES